MKTKPTSKRINTKRLRKVADHLLSGNLIHENWDFQYVNCSPNDTDNYKSIEGNLCGTKGCALGELPFIFPKSFSLCKNKLLGKSKKLKVVEQTDVDLCNAFFGLKKRETRHLFFVNEQREDWGKTLYKYATKEEVAENILKFCELAEQDKLYESNS